MKEMDAEAKRLAKLRDRMLKGLNAKLTDIYVNGDLEHRIRATSTSASPMSRASR